MRPSFASKQSCWHEGVATLDFPEMVSNDGLPLQSLGRLRIAVEEFRCLYPAMPTAYLDAFLAVALSPGLGPTEYAKLTGTTQPIMSRLLLEIGEQSREREEPLHLVVSRRHPGNRRQICFFLTSKGYALALRMGLMIEGRWKGMAAS